MRQKRENNKKNYDGLDNDEDNNNQEGNDDNDE
jgi:hypothetical protein